MSGAEHLVAMANDISNFFQSEPDRQVAADSVLNHIRRYWEPRMRKKILLHFTQHNGEGLSELAHAAIAKLAEQESKATA